MSKKEKGLTIIELLATIAILVTTVAVVLVLGNRAISQTDFISLHTEAVFLAREGVEILKDSSVRSDMDFGSEGDTTYWDVDYRGNIDPRNSESECSRKLRESGGFYVIGSNSGTESVFHRCITAKREEGVVRTKIDVGFVYRGSEQSVTLYRDFYE